MVVCAWGASSLSSTFPVDDKAGRITQRQLWSSESPQPQPIQDLPQSLTQGHWVLGAFPAQHGSPPGGCLCCEGPVGLGASCHCALLGSLSANPISSLLSFSWCQILTCLLDFPHSILPSPTWNIYRHYSQSTPHIPTYSQCLLPEGSNRLTYLQNKGTGYSRCNCNIHHSWYYYYYYYFPWLRKTCSPSDQANLEWQVQRMSVLSLTSNYQTEQILCIATMYCRSWLGAGERGLLNLKDLSFTNAHIHFNCSAHKGYRHTLRVCKAAQVSWGINEF